MTEKRTFLERAGIDFEAQEGWKRHGTLIRWETVPHAGVNPMTGHEIMTTRQRIHQSSEISVGDQLAKLVKEVV